MSSDHEIYPMPLFPRLTVSDVETSTAWYRTVGFDVVYSGPSMAHVRYRKYADVMLAGDGAGRQDEPAEARGCGVTLYVTVEGESVDDVAERVEAAGGTPSEEPHDTPWNTRELVVGDPDGYEIAFAEVRDPERSFEEVTGSPPGDS